MFFFLGFTMDDVLEYRKKSVRRQMEQDRLRLQEEREKIEKEERKLS